MFKLLSTPAIRYPWAVDSPTSGTTNAITPGMVVQIAQDEEIEVCANVLLPLGIAWDSKDATEVETAGSGKMTVVMGSFIGQSDQLESGVSFDTNVALYSNSSGKICRTSASATRIGTALGPQDSDGILTFLFNIEH